MVFYTFESDETSTLWVRVKGKEREKGNMKESVVLGVAGNKPARRCSISKLERK